MYSEGFFQFVHLEDCIQVSELPPRLLHLFLLQQRDVAMGITFP